MKCVVKRVISFFLLVSMVVTMLAVPTTTASAATTTLDQYVKVNSVSVNQTTSTVTLNYSILETLPSTLMNVYMNYTYGIPRISGGSVLLERTKGTYTKSLTITDYHCTIYVDLKLTAYTYSESKSLTHYFINSAKTVTYHTVTAVEAGAAYIAVSALGVYLTYAPQTSAVKIAAQITMWAGLGEGFATVTGMWNGTWQPEAGQYMQITTYYLNNQFCEDTLVWINKESYTKGVTANYSFKTRYDIP